MMRAKMVMNTAIRKTAAELDTSAEHDDGNEVEEYSEEEDSC
jgi:hypothetical protein